LRGGGGGGGGEAAFPNQQHFFLVNIVRNVNIFILFHTYETQRVFFEAYCLLSIETRINIHRSLNH